MLSSFTGVFSKLKQTKLVQNISKNYQEMRKQANKKMEFVEIMPNLYHITYPENQMIKDLKNHIERSDYQIWNVGEYRYPIDIQRSILEDGQNGEIHHLCFEYYSNLPLYELIIAVNSIHYFLQINPKHKVYIHCQDNRLRSCVFLACFVYKFNILKINDVSQAILFINKKLGTNLEVQHNQDSQTVNYKNQHMFFKNYVNYLNSPQIINKHKLQLLKIIISEAPKLKINQKDGSSLNLNQQMKVCLEIRSKQKVILKGTYDSGVFQGDSICIQLSNRTLILGDDFLVMIKYINGGKIYGMMRIQLNTNFIFQKFFRAHQQFIDLSSYCHVDKKKGTFIDFLFDENLSSSDLANLHEMPSEQKRRTHKKHQTKQMQIKEQELKKSKELKKELPSQNFVLDDPQQEQYQVDEHEINRKIEAVMKNIANKQTELQINTQQEEENVEEWKKEIQEGKKEVEKEVSEQDKEDDEQDLDDYLSKLQSQV